MKGMTTTVNKIRVQENVSAFYNVKLNLLGIFLGEEWLEKVYHDLQYTDPIAHPWKISEYVQRTIEPCSKDETSVKVYAILCEKTEEEMLEQMVSEGR